MTPEAKRFNTDKCKRIISSRYRNNYTFANEIGMNAGHLNYILRTGKATQKNIEKIAKGLGIDPSEISDTGNNKPYWWVSDQDYPVDISFCSKCWIWNTTCKCCDYLERKGKLIPDGHIVVHPDGRHTCKYREIGQRSTGPYENSSEF